eukprot:CAMPEP_0181373728 /NCGR_PEP_ID=MMETSP1106-20121128/15564_1 /TAXON_ID=81844 /ORGANISM="Mantoniella antarctica, Strain SL-175" /LENGTH=170 /DNA_ID=CAMNT_0023491507 /DNA_START=25 /DNA_END=538 /DNA_ORIENTATION=+
MPADEVARPKTSGRGVTPKELEEWARKKSPASSPKQAPASPTILSEPEPEPENEMRKGLPDESSVATSRLIQATAAYLVAFSRGCLVSQGNTSVSSSSRVRSGTPRCPYARQQRRADSCPSAGGTSSTERESWCRTYPGGEGTNTRGSFFPAGTEAGYHRQKLYYYYHGA